MNPLELLARTLPFPALDASEELALQELAHCTQALGYSEQNLSSLLGLTDLGNLWFREIAGLRHRCRHQATPLARLAAAWLLGEPGGDWPLAAETVRVLEKLGLCGPRGARASLFPCQGLALLTDPLAGELAFQHAVYTLGSDSYALARLTPRQPVRRALDLCSGSGVQALLASRHADETLGVDLNPRAVAFGRLNARLNGLSVHFERSDLYSAVAGRFDLITCNPPFVPTPEEHSELYRSGGPDGEALIERIVGGLGEHLESGGRFVMVSHYPLREVGFIQRLRGWLGPGRWGVACLNLARHTNERYTAMNVRSDRPLGPETEAWLDSFRRQGIRGVVQAVTYIVREAEFEAERDLPLPPEPISEVVDAWLRALGCGPLKRPLRAHPQSGRLLVDGEGCGVALHATRAWAPLGVELSAAEVEILRQLPAPLEEADEASLRRLVRELLIEC